MKIIKLIEYYSGLPVDTAVKVQNVSESVNNILAVMVQLVDIEDSRRFQRKFEIPSGETTIDVRLMRDLYPLYKSSNDQSATVRPATLLDPQQAALASQEGTIYKPTAIFPIAWVENGFLKILPHTEHNFLFAMGVHRIDLENDPEQEIEGIPQALGSATIYLAGALFIMNFGITREYESIDYTDVPDTLIDEMPTLSIDGNQGHLEIITPPADLTSNYTPADALAHYNLKKQSFPTTPVLDYTVADISLVAYPPTPQIAEDTAVLALEEYPTANALSDLGVVLPGMKAFPAQPTTIGFDPDQLTLTIGEPPAAPTGLAPATTDSTASTVVSTTIENPVMPEGDKYTKEQISISDANIDTRSANDDVELMNSEIVNFRTKIEKANAKMQDELNRVNTLIQEYQGKIQHSIQQGQISLQEKSRDAEMSTNVSIDNAQRALTAAIEEKRNIINVYQNEINAIVSNNQNKIGEFTARVQSRVQKDQLEISAKDSHASAAAAENQAIIQRYTTEVDAWSKEVTTKIADFNSKVQKTASNNQNKIQEYIAKVDAVIKDNQTIIQHYQSEVQRVSSENNELINQFQSRVGKLSAENQSKISLYQSEVQKIQFANSEMMNALAQDEQAKFQKVQADVAVFNANVQKVMSHNQALISEAQFILTKYVELNKLNVVRFQGELQYILTKFQTMSSIKLQEFQNKMGALSTRTQAIELDLKNKYQQATFLFNQFQYSVRAYVNTSRRTQMPTPRPEDE